MINRVEHVDAENLRGETNGHWTAIQLFDLCKRNGAKLMERSGLVIAETDAENIRVIGEVSQLDEERKAELQMAS